MSGDLPDRAETYLHDAVEAAGSADEIEAAGRGGGEVNTRGRVFRGEEALNLADELRVSALISAALSLAVNVHRIAEAMEAMTFRAADADSRPLHAYSTAELSETLAERLRTEEGR